MNVISLAVFRDRASPNAEKYKGLFYPRHIPAIVRGYLNLFPGWQLRFHHDDSLLRGPHGALLYAMQSLAPDRIKLVHVRGVSTLCGSMLWRMLPLYDIAVDAWICRDLDSMPTPREAMMVSDWLESNALLHCIHDCHTHGGGAPMMGGMIGLRGAARKALEGLRVPTDCSSGRLSMMVQGDDQLWLNEHCWPRLKDSCLFHKHVDAAHHDCERPAQRVRAPAPGERVPAHLLHLWNDEAGHLTLEADNLGLHVGLVFDPVRASAWWDIHGLSEVRELVKAAENMAQTGDAWQVGIAPMPRDRERVDAWFASEWHNAKAEPSGPRVVIGIDCHPHYAFLAPIATAFWSHICGRRTNVLVVESREARWNEGWGLAVINTLRAVGADVHFIRGESLYRTSTLAQASRCLAGALPVFGSPLITSDADMLPMSADFFAESPQPGELKLYCADAYPQHNGPHYPICYIEAYPDTWSSITELSRSSFDWYEGDISLHLSSHLADILADLGRADEGRAWNFDEWYISRKIARWTGPLKRVNRGSAAPPHDRLDRCNFPQGWNRLTDDDIRMRFIDAHLPRPSHTDQVWPYIRRLIDLMIPREVAAVLSEYRRRFVAHQGVNP